jgi:hypothetical protein
MTMSNKMNERRKGDKRTENGPRWESHNPGAGCNSTHVARSRKKWKRRMARSERHTGKISVKFRGRRRAAAPPVVEE